MATVYILYSSKIDNYYVGSCIDLESRIAEHNSNSYKNSFTSRANDWKVILTIDSLNQLQARKIEEHIKKMKSRKYFKNLINYPEIIEKLIQRF